LSGSAFIFSSLSVLLKIEEESQLVNTQILNQEMNLRTSCS